MAILNIEKYPSEVLKRKALPVDSVDETVRTLMDNMLETMYAGSGVGLAAPQVGLSTRVIVVDANVSEDDDYPVLMLANPEIIKAEGSVEFEEGCLSVPNFTTLIKRYSDITVKALDRDGNEITIEAGGLLAIVLQHEIDHLEGKLILDRASSIKREFYRKRIRKNATAAG